MSENCSQHANLLNSRTGRMEAKGCAKPMVWKDARRRFYWALRAKIAMFAALDEIEEASPESTLEYRTRLLQTLSSIDDTTDRRIAAETYETIDLAPTLAQLRADYLVRRMLALSHEDRKATIGGLVRLVDNLSDDEKSTLASALQSSGRSPGMWDLVVRWNCVVT